jgi:hypothetical protein
LKVAVSKKSSTLEKRTLILWGLLVRENAAAFQNELKPEPLKADRDVLSFEGLIRWERRGRRIWIEATDKGWAWAGKNLDAALPANSSAGSQILRAWLTRLMAFMERREIVLADILGPHNSRKSAADNHVNAPSTWEPRDYLAIRDRVRQAYLDVTGGRLNERALLSKVREKLSDIERTRLDDTLRNMHLEEGTILSGLNNPQEITKTIRDAGLNFKGQDMFVLWITK